MDKLNLVHGYFADSNHPNYTLLLQQKFDDIIELYQNKIDLSSSDLNILGIALRSKCKYIQAYNTFFNSMKKDQNSFSLFNLGRIFGEASCFFRREDIFNSKIGSPTLPKIENIQLSCFNESYILQNLFSKLNLDNKFFVDIGAGDGVTFSNTYQLQDWNGVCIEPNGESFYSLSYFLKNRDNVVLLKEYVTPKNVLHILDTLNVPSNFAFLSLDIDSYDYYVLQELLKKYSPGVICTEINELFPPPIKFALKYQDNLDISDKLNGQSICMAENLFNQYGYRIVYLEYNNLIAVRCDLLENTDIVYLNAHLAYQNGFLNKQDWYLKFLWNGQQLNEIFSMKTLDEYYSYYKELIDNPFYYFSIN